MYWRYNWWKQEAYPSCKPINLSEGMLISHYVYSPVKHITSGVYQQQCWHDSVPMMNTNMGLVIDKFTTPLPIAAQSWQMFTKNNAQGSFAYSVVSIVYAISILFVIIWFLTIFVLTNYTIKPSLLMKASTMLSSFYILLVVGKSMAVLHDQQRAGYLHGTQLLEVINDYLPINIVDLVVVILLQINQVQVIMRIFLRQKDKRTAFFIGIFASITSQVIWAVAKFYKFKDNNEAGDTLPAFIYLVRIVMGLCYAAIISVYLLTKIYYIIANKTIWLLSLLTIVLIYSPVAFFVADVSNAFVYELSEVFSVVTYVICVVIPWEWCNKFNIIQKAKEKEGVLGRKFYEDELYELDRFELFVEEDRDDDFSGGNGEDIELLDRSRQEGSSSQSQRLNHSIPDSATIGKTNRLFMTLRKTKESFLALTDNIIAAGFAIPRSVSVSTQSIDASRSKNTHLERMDAQLSNHQTSTRTRPDAVDSVPTGENLEGSSRNRRNVFVYSTKEVRFHNSDDES
ncbi:uncharacterized protein CANTADRAFT_24499 [Suhomyces tanzawaensis NRRL Y-17324]|uniref:pH-response regulator protein palH/RIM21 n=1 Tax=Suhomyces tanzawaensis NRRL Y-17324 TaxID=984487 RepID=A0A1E4SQ31_9ASCO|nr:uncharacterized protein CANTADRAFT_24499 [Suhomyces tanzawaensis NRRL Y-17324]ODV81624.1 hypothetical protein CANTADRAFT_24499 [Suhomyces tanzawaensis NRRL Y-17324]